jgi:predicted nucleic acid-binding protein
MQKGPAVHGLTVVTANASEFSRVTGLSWEGWTT